MASLRNEDWLAVWIGAVLIALVLAGAPLGPPPLRWATDDEAVATARRQRVAVEGLTRTANPVGGAATTLLAAIERGDRAAIASGVKALDAAAASEPADAKKRAGAVSKALAPASAYPSKLVAADVAWRLVVVGFALLVVCGLGVASMGGSVARFVPGFVTVYLLAHAAIAIAGNATVGYWGLEYVVWALAIGLAWSNLGRVPQWLQPAVRTEYYIKTGLVILGAGVLFGEILQAGILGIAQALLVVGVVWWACFALARRLRVDDEFGVILASAVSICGVSAAIAACGAIQGDRRKLSYVTSLVLVCAVPMMIAQPWAARTFGIPDLVAGAWLGGTLDTSGSVVAAGALVSEAAMKVGVIVKFSQNVLIGVAAFVLAVWWTMRRRTDLERPNATIIWERFPKFVLGFMAASCVFSFALGADWVAGTKDVLVGLRTVLFAMAFVCIGLETRFDELVSMEGGRPAAAFVGAQAVNVAWTLLLAYLLFGGVLFAVPDVGR
jgi:uncharacterized membrane protein YadS